MNKRTKPKARRVSAKIEEPDPKTAQYFDPMPNPMFPDWLTGLIAFARYPEAVPCALCGRRTRHHWTMKVPFTAVDVKAGQFQVPEGKTVFRQGSPVCRDHLMVPAWRTPTADDSKSGEAESLLAALRDPERDLSVRGPGGYAFRLAAGWGTVDDINADPTTRVNLAHHVTLAHALDCISAKIPERRPSKR